MKKEELKQAAKKVGEKLKDNSPNILTGVGIAGMATSVILAVKVTPNAYYKICKEEERQEKDLKKREKIKLVWKSYLPCTASFILSSVCLVESASQNSKRQAALAAAYTLTQNAFDDYRNGVIEKFGEDKSREIESKAAIKRAEDNPPDNILVTPYGDYLCREDYSGLYFRCTLEKVRNALERVNNKIKQEGCASLNDLYDYIGLPATGISRTVGWNINDLGDGPDEDLKICDDYNKSVNGEPCCIIHYTVDPHAKYNYFR